VKGKAEIGFPGAKLSIEGGTATVDDVLNDLTFELNRAGRKIIVVVDDLDRIGTAAIRKVLFAVKRTFNLPNVNYILCYDTEMLVQSTSEKNDSTAAREFLEEFVGVKIALFVSSERLVAYMRESVKNALAERLLLKSETVFALMGVITAIAESYRQRNGWRYRALLGDIRKVKRLVNVLLLLQFGNVDFEKMDFNKGDLLNMLLLYLTYPGRFRDIYANESEGRTGIYSIIRKYEHGTYEYYNHGEFSAQISNRSDGEAFLLRQLFDPPTLGLKDRFRGDDEEFFLRTRACFNDEYRRNLERYLKLIVDLDAPPPESSLAYYLSCFEELKSGTVKIADLTERLRSATDEKQISEFWRVVANRAHELSPGIADQVIRHLAEVVPTYSLLEWQDPAIGFRDDATKTLLQVLDAAGWFDEQSERRNNTPANIARIGWWIFGPSIAEERGVFMTLVQEKRGLLGFFDALMFRLYCNPGRSSLFSVSGALIRRADPNARTDGALSELNKNAVREMSQTVFRVFRDRYITPARNVFDDTASLGPQDLAGQFGPQIEALLAEEVDRKLADQLQRARRRVVGFTTYQLANRGHGDTDYGCGFFDQEGAADGGGIAKAMNDYVFGVCFNPEASAQNLEHFADYMLGDLELAGGGRGPRPTVSGLVHGLDKENLRAYWKNNKLLLIPLTTKKKSVVTANYVASYSDDLPKVFQVLDALIEGAAESIVGSASKDQTPH
jgi:hypothetical protein